MGAPGVRFELEGGRLHLLWPELAQWLDVVARCRLKDGSVHDSQDWRAGPKGLETSSGPLKIRLALAVEECTVRARITAVAEEDCVVQRLGLVGRVRVQDEVPRWFLYNGYQSWDAAGLMAIQPGAALQSWWNSGAAIQSGAGLAAGAASAARFATQLRLDGTDLEAMQRMPDDATGQPPPIWTAKAKDRWEGEELVFAAAVDVRAAQAQISSGRRPAPDVPCGWLSWYHFGPWISAEDVQANAAELKTGQLSRRGLDHIQIDDGWQQAWGDWQPNSKFGPDFGGLPAKLTADGFKTGVWLAPFLVAPDSDLSSKAPDDWFLRDPASGRRLADPREEHLRTFYVLDARNPAVLKHLTETFAELKRQGFGYFKIDFLYAGAYPGMEPLREGVQAIRDGIGEDAYLLGCGGPLLPMVGLVDGCRIAIDTCSMLFDFEKGQPMAVYVSDEIRQVARNVAWRQPLRGWFQLDPDVALAGGNSSLEEARQLVTVVAISGGPFFLSDDLPNLAPERKHLLTNPEVLDLAGTGTVCPDWETDNDGAPPAVWRRPDGVIAIFNWTSRERELVVPLQGLTCARDLWVRRDLGVLDDPLRLILPPSGVRLMRLTNA